MAATVNAISQSRFNALVDTKNPAMAMIAEERAWFEAGGEKLLGTVIFDKTDKDWTYVVMERADDKRFRWVEGNVSLESQEKATSDLKTAMQNRLARKNK